jgi:hypothetical protein
MLEEARKYKLVPEEIFSEKNHTANDGGLAKTLFYNIVLRLRVPEAIPLVDASYCYDCVAHAMALLIFQSFGMEDMAVTAMLETIQKMKIFLRTVFGDSKEFAGSTIKVKTQGLDQGNGASLVGWCIISIMILWVHEAKSHGAHYIAPISHMQSSLSAILYVDDTDLLHLNMDGDETIAKTHVALQRTIQNWGKLLIATWGTLKPEKCFYHLMDFQWTRRCGWQYIGNPENETASMFVLLPNGLTAIIQHRAVDDTQKTLGIITCPSGNSTDSLTQMKEKTKKWLDSLTNGQLHPRMMRISVDCKLWPSVKYGLCCSMATLSELKSVLLLLKGKMLPLGGIVWTASIGIRQIDWGIWRRSLTSRRRGNSGAVKQAPYALRLLNCFRYQTSNIPWPPTCRNGS